MKCTDEQIINAASNCNTMFEAARSLNLHINSFRARAKRLGVYTPNRGRKGVPRDFSEGARSRIPLAEILNGHHPQYSTSALRKRLFNEGVKPKCCEMCNITDERVTLTIDHINGINNDHRIENLRVLCPNCHSNTETFAGRNKKSSGTPVADHQLIDLILADKSTIDILKDVGLTPYGVNYRRIDRLRGIIEHIKSKMQHNTLPL